MIFHYFHFNTIYIFGIAHRNHGRIMPTTVQYVFYTLDLRISTIDIVFLNAFSFVRNIKLEIARFSICIKKKSYPIHYVDLYRFTCLICKTKTISIFNLNYMKSLMELPTLHTSATSAFTSDCYYIKICLFVFQGIAAREKNATMAHANVLAGGIGYTFVTIRLKSERSKGLNYDIKIYSNLVHH